MGGSALEVGNDEEGQHPTHEQKGPGRGLCGNVAPALAKAAPCPGLDETCLFLRQVQLEDGQGDQRVGARLHEEIPGRPEPEEQKAADSRSDGAHHGPPGLHQRNRARGHGLRHNRKDDRLAQRPADRLADAAEKAEEKERPNHTGIPQQYNAEAEADGEEPGAGGIEQFAMGEPINGHAGDGRQPQHGNRAHQVERAQHGPGRGQVVDQPTQGHLLDPLRGIGERGPA